MLWIGVGVDVVMIGVGTIVTDGVAVGSLVGVGNIVGVSVGKIVGLGSVVGVGSEVMAIGAELVASWAKEDSLKDISELVIKTKISNWLIIFLINFLKYFFFIF